jgi:hypothetical protein
MRFIMPSKKERRKQSKRDKARTQKQKEQAGQPERLILKSQPATNDPATSQGWAEWASSSLFTAVKAAQSSVSGLSGAARTAAFKAVFYPLMAQMVAAYSLGGSSDLCATFNLDCRDANVQNATGPGRAEFSRDIDPPFGGREASSASRDLLRSCLDIDGDNIEKFVSSIIDQYGFGDKACSVQDTFNRWIVQFVIDGIGPQADCDQINARWDQTVEQCGSLEEILAAAAKAGIAIGVLVVLAAVGAGIYYACKKGVSCSSPCQNSDAESRSTPGLGYSESKV